MDFMISHFANEPANAVLNSRRMQQTTTGANQEVSRDDKGILSRMAKEQGAEGDENCLPPEVEEGNIEYKVKLVNPSSTRMQHLITQMKWRLREGQGEAIYELGVEDKGSMAGLTDSDLDASIATLNSMASALNANLLTLTERSVKPKVDGEPPRRVVEVLVRQVPENQHSIELRLAVLGDGMVGKSTLCGVLSHGLLDNGKGKTRLNLFRYLHEFQTGRTSSICTDVVGFDSCGKLLNNMGQSQEEVVGQSTKLITLIDLAGHEKYLRTTIYGLTGYKPHFAGLLVSAMTGPTQVTREHMGFAAALNIPFFIVITKVDIVPPAAKETAVQSVEMLLNRSGMGELARRVHTAEDAISCAALMANRNVVPIFSLSSVTGVNLDLLKYFLNSLPQSGLPQSEQAELLRAPLIFSVEEVFRVPHVGVVVCGLLCDGIMKVGDAVQIGPDKVGVYHRARVNGIRRNKQPVSSIQYGESGSVAISLDQPCELQGGEGIRRGMVMLNAKDVATSCKRFTAKLYLLYHPSDAICAGFQGTVYVGSVCQTATLIDMDTPSVRTRAWGIVRFEFFSNREFLRPGMLFLFRGGRTKGMGEVISVELGP